MRRGTDGWEHLGSSRSDADLACSEVDVNVFDFIDVYMLLGFH